jgi:hypothetical protein
MIQDRKELASIVRTDIKYWERLVKTRNKIEAVQLYKASDFNCAGGFECLRGRSRVSPQRVCLFLVPLRCCGFSRQHDGSGQLIHDQRM